MPKRKIIVAEPSSEDTETDVNEDNEGDEGEAVESDGEEVAAGAVAENPFISAVALGANISKKHIKDFMKFFPSAVESLVKTVGQLKDNVEVCWFIATCDICDVFIVGILYVEGAALCDRGRNSWHAEHQAS